MAAPTVFPSDWPRVWLFGHYIDARTGRPATGKVTVTADITPGRFVDRAGHTVYVLTRSWTANLDADGYVEFDLPEGITYRVVEPATRHQVRVVLAADTPVLDRPGHRRHGERAVDLSDLVDSGTPGKPPVQVVRGDTGRGIDSIVVDGATLVFGMSDDSSVRVPLPPSDSGTVVRLGTVRPAARALSGHRVVTPGPAGLDYASNTDAAHVAAPLWVTTGAAAAGEPVAVTTTGPVIEPSWTWTAGPVYLGANGQLTQTAPAAPGALFCAQIGYAVSATELHVDRTPSIRLN